LLRNTFKEIAWILAYLNDDIYEKKSVFIASVLWWY
jgi:hypothetical protein